MGQVLKGRVAPLAGSVDRNPYEVRVLLGEKVAPLAGSVDRNAHLHRAGGSLDTVAPLAGSVDRNDGEEDGGFLPFSRSPRGERG